MLPKVTVLTTVYNGLPYLREAIESTLSQTYTDFDYLIIDDASTDNSVECILSYKDPRIKFMQNKKNLGPSSTWNKALSNIKTPYVVRLDQDDVNLPNRLKEQIGYLEKNPNISVISSLEIVINSKGKKIRNARGRLNNYGEFIGKVLLGLAPIWHPSLAFRKKDLDTIGGFKEGYSRAEDFEVTCNFAKNRFNADIIQDFHLFVRVHPKSQSATFFKDQEICRNKIHDEIIDNFVSSKNSQCLSALLRLEKDPCGKKYDKFHMLDLVKSLDLLISNVKNKQNLTNHELKSLKKIIFNRIGFGVRYAKFFSWTPSFLYYSIFFILSPLLIPQLRINLSKFYKKIQELGYAFRYH